jgi:hypothetical protein
LDWSYVLQCSSFSISPLKLDSAKKTTKHNSQPANLLPSPLIVSSSDDNSGHSHAAPEFKAWQAEQDHRYKCLHKEKSKQSSAMADREPSDVEIEESKPRFVFCVDMLIRFFILFYFCFVQKTQVLQTYQHG